MKTEKTTSLGLQKYLITYVTERNAGQIVTASELELMCIEAARHVMGKDGFRRHWTEKSNGLAGKQYQVITERVIKLK